MVAGHSITNETGTSPVGRGHALRPEGIVKRDIPEIPVCWNRFGRFCSGDVIIVSLAHVLTDLRDNPPRAGSRHRYQNSASTTDRVYDPDPKPRLPYGHTPSETRRKGPGYHPRNLSPPPRNMPPSLGGPSADPHGSSNDGSLWRFRGTDSG